MIDNAYIFISKIRVCQIRADMVDTAACGETTISASAGVVIWGIRALLKVTYMLIYAWS